jgi:hypothetical protein
MAWISVKKGLPEVNEIVIGYTNRGRMLFVWVDAGTLEFDEQDIVPLVSNLCMAFPTS